LRHDVAGSLQMFVESPTNHVNKFTIGLSADATTATMAGTIGFFQVVATAMANLPAAHLGAGLVMDANGLSLSHPTLTGSAKITLALHARIQFSNTALTFPHMPTNFIEDWNLAGPANASHEALGSAPTVKFDNVQFGLGSFLGNMIQPVANFIQQ